MSDGRRIGHDRRREDRSEQERLRSIVDHVAEGIVIVSREGAIHFANPAAERLFGRPASELAGRDLGFPVVTGDNAEVEVVRPHQQTVTAELRAVDIEWQGMPAHLISLRDVTDRKQAKERAAQLDRERLARTEAEAANQAKSEFLALMSHELRTPLNAVIGYADLLQMGLAGALSPEQRQQVLRIAASGRHLLGLVNEVLDLARVEAGRLQLHRGRSQSQATVDAALTLVRPIADAGGVALTATPGTGEAVCYEGDEDRVRQILVNLLNNGVKFTPSGGRVSVTWGATSQREENAKLYGVGPWCYFRVEDSGMGIPADQLASIFEPFVQVDKGHTRAKEGSGLGLTISRRLARLMKGDLTVRSELGKGSVFTLWLPDATNIERQLQRWRAQSPELAERLYGLGDVGKIVVRELDAILDKFVARVREESVVQSARGLRDCELTNHLGEFVVGLAGTLAAIEQGQGRRSGIVAERGTLQSLIIENHGKQRSRLGWTPGLMRREWSILREEIERVIRLEGRTIPDAAVAEALMQIGRAIDDASEASAEALFRASPSTTTELIREQASRGD